MSAESTKELARKIAKLFVDQPRSTCLTAMGVAFAATVTFVTKDEAAQDEAIELFATQARALMDMFNKEGT